MSTNVTITLSTKYGHQKDRAEGPYNGATRGTELRVRIMELPEGQSLRFVLWSYQKDRAEGPYNGATRGTELRVCITCSRQRSSGKRARASRDWF